MSVEQQIAKVSKYSDLTTRTVSALVMAALALAGLWAGGIWSVVLIAAAGALMMWEWRRISCPVGGVFGALAYSSAVVSAAVLTWTGQPIAALATLTASAGMMALIDSISARPALWGVTGALYIGLSVMFFTAFRLNPAHGMGVILFIVLVVIATDVGAYFSGRKFGRRKLAPKISPNKTWAGLIGGVVAAVVVGGLFAVIALDHSGAELLAVAACLSLASQLGDLSESAYKRRFGVKDSGHLIPGHGGLLDRFDGLLAAILAAMAIVVMRGGTSILVW